MPTDKAPGFDKVPISVVKDCLEHILPTLTDLINHSFSSSVFPLAWKQDEVIPHQKSGEDCHASVQLVTDNILRAMDSRQITATVLIDLSKAFD
ncbi:hypothetical protein pdam_00024343, partial [Pocillopora damicornis]